MASLVWTLNSSANGLVGTVAGTVMNALLYNSGETADVMTVSTDDFEAMAEWSTETAFGFDPLIGGMTNGTVLASEVHCIGCGCTCACVCRETEIDDDGCEVTTASETFH